MRSFCSSGAIPMEQNKKLSVLLAAPWDQESGGAVSAHGLTTARVQDARGVVASAEPRSSFRALDSALLNGVSWSGGMKGVTLFLSWASTIFVARILSPEDYGIVAMAVLYLGLMQLVTDFGLSAAVVALRDLKEDEICQLHAVSILVGVAGFLVSCAAAIPLARFFKVPALAVVVVAMGTSVIWESLRSVPTALLAKALRFKYLAVMETVKVVVAVSLTLALALSGAKYWSLVIGNVAASLLVTIFILLREPLRVVRPRFRSLKRALTFSSQNLTEQVAWYGYSNADFLVAGRFLGKIALGQYSLAWTLTSTPGEKLTSIFGRIMPTMFAAVQRDTAALRRYFLLFTEALAIVIVPASVGLGLVAPDFVLLVFGAKWSPAIIPMQLLCCYAAIHLLVTPMVRVLQVRGQAAFTMRTGLYALAILPLAFYFAGARWGTIGIAAMWLVVYPLILAPVYARTFRTLGISLFQYLACLGPTLMSAALMSIVVLTIRILAPAAWPLTVRLGLQVACGAVAFIASGLFLQRRRVAALADFLRAIRSEAKTV
jgi:O-antigen/teichoic acid export membrane protein